MPCPEKNSIYHDLKLWNLMNFVCHVHQDTKLIMISTDAYTMILYVFFSLCGFQQRECAQTRS